VGFSLILCPENGFLGILGHLKGDLIPEKGQILREVGIPHLSLENYKNQAF
jgi:hypothetical protein